MWCFLPLLVFAQSAPADPQEGTRVAAPPAAAELSSGGELSQLLASAEAWMRALPEEASETLEGGLAALQDVLGGDAGPVTCEAGTARSWSNDELAEVWRGSPFLHPYPEARSASASVWLTWHRFPGATGYKVRLQSAQQVSIEHELAQPESASRVRWTVGAPLPPGLWQASVQPLLGSSGGPVRSATFVVMEPAEEVAAPCQMQDDADQAFCVALWLLAERRYWELETHLEQKSSHLPDELGPAIWSAALRCEGGDR